MSKNKIISGAEEAVLYAKCQNVRKAMQKFEARLTAGLAEIAKFDELTTSVDALLKHIEGGVRIGVHSRLCPEIGRASPGPGEPSVPSLTAGQANISEVRWAMTFSYPVLTRSVSLCSLGNACDSWMEI